MLVAGGGDRVPGFQAGAAIFDPRRGRWTRVASMPQPRGFGVASRLPDGRVLIAGGLNDRGPLATSVVYDARRGRWRSAGTAAAAYSEVVAPLPRGRVLVAGGQGARGGAVTRAEIYTP